jgi:glycosyltransferase involved in cell wall biosynthesis
LRVALFYPLSIYSAWSCSQGLHDTLVAMGHDVEDCPIVPDPKLPLSRSKYPKNLEEFDRVIVSGPEHLHPFLLALYPDFENSNVKTIGWWHETVNRSDYGTLDYKQINRNYDTVFTPAKQDELYGMNWLPFGVDLKMFTPGTEPCFDLGFVGLLYGKRQEWLKTAGIENLRMARVEATGPNGTDVRWSARLLAESYRSFRVFLNLPSLCEHVVTKVYEAMACGVALVTPFQDGPGRENFSIFENGKHLQYYADNPKGIISQLLEAPEYCQKMAKQGMEEVREKHDLKLRCEVLLEA